MLHLCTGCGVGVISDTQISLDINECPKVSVTNKMKSMAHKIISMVDVGRIEVV